MEEHLEQLLFTPAAVLDLLSSIDELQDKNIELHEKEEGFNISIGDSVYQISTEDVEQVSVEEDVVEQVEDIIDDAYDDLAEVGVFVEDAGSVTGGPIKSLLKTLMLGGLVKMTANMIKD